MNPERRALLQRAVDDARNLTPEETNAVLRLPPPDEERRLLQEAFGLASREALVVKALANDGDDLSFEEARWLERLGAADPFADPSVGAAFGEAEQSLGQPREDRALEKAGRLAVLTIDEGRARANAMRRAREVRGKRRQAAEETRERINELRRLPRAGWVQKMVDAGLPRWGFVVLRTAYGAVDGDKADDPCSDAAWARFREYFMQACQWVTLHRWKGAAELHELYEGVWVSDRARLEGADTAALRARVREMREAGEIPEGVRPDIFLVVDEAVLRHEQFVDGAPSRRTCHAAPSGCGRSTRTTTRPRHRCRPRAHTPGSTGRLRCCYPRCSTGSTILSLPALSRGP